MFGKRFTVVSLLLSLLAVVIFAQSEAKQYLPKGSTKFDIMQLMGSPRLVEIAQRLQAAVAKDKDWWMSYVQTAKEGQPLPYDTRMGITKDEYNEFLSLSGKFTLQRAGQTNLRFTWSSPDTVSIDGSKDIPQISGTLIDFKKGTVSTPFAVLSETTVINNTLEDGPTGPWVGMQWKHVEITSDFSSAISVKVAFGKLSRDGRGIMIYEAKVIKNNQKTTDIDLILYYDLP
jgi:hypothetical protein